VYFYLSFLSFFCPRGYRYKCKPENQFTQEPNLHLWPQWRRRISWPQMEHQRGFWQQSLCTSNCINLRMISRHVTKVAPLPTLKCKWRWCPCWRHPGIMLLRSRQCRIYLRMPASCLYDGNVYQASCMHRDNNGKADGNAVYCTKMTVEVPGQVRSAIFANPNGSLPAIWSEQPAHIQK